MPLYDEISEEMREELGKYVHRKWEEASASSLRAQVITDMKAARNAYDQLPTSEELWDGAINMVLPFLTISVDQLEPRLVASLTAHDRILTIDDPGQLDEQMKMDVETVDNVVLQDDVEIVKITKSHIHNMLLDGHVFLAPYWDFKEGKVRSWVADETGVPVDVPEEGVPEGMMAYAGKLMVEQIVKTNDKVRVDELDPEYVFFPDRIDDWEDAPVVYEHYMGWGEYKGKALRGVAGWVEYDEEGLEQLGDQVYDKRPETGKQLEEGTAEVLSDTDSPSEKLKSELRLLQAHCSYDVDEDGIEEKIVVTIEEKTKKIVFLISNAELDPLNRKQIRCTRLIPRAGTGYGYSLYSKLKMIQEGGSNTVNIMLNSAIIQMMPFFFYEEATGFAEAEIELYPGAGIMVGDVKRILMNTFQPNSAAFKDIIEIFFRLWNYIVTLPDYSLGVDPASEGSTATGTLALLQEASISHDYLGSTLHDQYTELFRMIHDICYLNMGPAREQEILGYAVPQKVLSSSYKIRMVASSKSANRHVERMEMQDALMVAEKGVELGVVVADAPIRDYLTTFKGVNVESWMNGPLAKINQRIREAMKAAEEGPKEGEVPDPFAQVVMQMLEQPPEELIDMLQATQIGVQIKDEMTEAMGGETKGSGMEEML